jgi:hypothetical protein
MVTLAINFISTMRFGSRRLPRECSSPESIRSHEEGRRSTTRGFHKGRFGGSGRIEADPRQGWGTFSGAEFGGGLTVWFLSSRNRELGNPIFMIL